MTTTTRVIVTDTNSCTTGRYEFATEELADEFISRVADIEYQYPIKVSGDGGYQPVAADEIDQIIREDFYDDDYDDDDDDDDDDDTEDN